MIKQQYCAAAITSVATSTRTIGIIHVFFFLPFFGKHAILCLTICIIKYSVQLTTIQNSYNHIIYYTKYTYVYIPLI